MKDLPLLGPFHGHRSERELGEWLRDGEVYLFVAFHGGRAAAYDCISLEVPAYPPFSRLTLGKDDVWVRDVYTIPEYRCRGVIRTLRACRNAEMTEVGFRHTVSAVAEDNIASLAASPGLAIQARPGRWPGPFGAQSRIAVTISARTTC